MRRKDVKNVYQEVDHRGSMSEVIRNFQLEMRLVDNINKENPVYSLEKE
jgi:hypothetical protein